MSDTHNNICFVANYTKTFTFHEVARRLEQQGYRVYWIVVNRRIRDFLAERYDPARLLYLGRSYADTPNDKIGEFKINELVLGDRVLGLDPEQGRRYLLHIQQPLYRFIKENQISHIFGELTWAHEVLVRRITAGRPELGCMYLNPHTIRIPNGRFAFFTDEFQSEMVAAPSTAAEQEPLALTVEKPDYLALNDRLVKNARSLTARLQKVKRFITAENIDDDDPTLINRRWQRFRLRCREELNRELYRFARRISLDEVGDRRFAFVALHKQPEASIDVIGRYYENQLTNIINLWRIIPDDWLLLVKEHTNAIGDRGLDFYRRLRKLPNVFLIRETEDSHDIIRRSELVVTVSGTVAYEAALMGKRALTLAPTFFNRFPNCRRVGLDDLREARDIFELTDRLTAEPAEVEAYVAGHSFPGVISDPNSNPRSVEPDNLDSLARAVMQVVG